MAAMQNFCNDFYQITVPILAIFFLMYKQLLPAKLNFGDNCVLSSNDHMWSCWVVAYWEQKTKVEAYKRCSWNSILPRNKTVIYKGRLREMVAMRELTVVGGA